MVALHDITERMFAPVRSLRTRRRSLREWAEAEVILPPTGPAKNQRYKGSRQPVSAILLDEIDSGRWTEIVATGPSQSSKTFTAFACPLLYRLLECEETTIMAVPEADMADDKWTQDILPIMEASPRMRAMIPKTGPGSKGGKVKDRVDFPNGASLKIMSRGGKDTAKAGFTARSVHVTEAAGFSVQTLTSKESDPLRQFRARQRAFSRDRRLLVVEGTLTTTADLPWRLKGHEEALASTMSQLLAPCPHCPEWISPGREDFVGWMGAKTAVEAAENSHFRCPKCGHKITEEERIAAIQHVQLVHYGQRINQHGEVIGELPSTFRLWYHWSQWHNLLVPATDHAIDEWEKEQILPHSQDWYDKEKELCQFVWAIPYEPQAVDVIPLTEADIYGRGTELRRGVVPLDAVKMSAGVDLRGRQLHYVVIAWKADGCGHIVDLGILPLEYRQYGTKTAVMRALRRFRDTIIEPGFKDQEGKVCRPQLVLIDLGWRQDVVRMFIAECVAAGNRRFLGCFGRGQSEPRGKGGYSHPDKTNKTVLHIGDQFHLRSSQKYKTPAFFANSDEWKTNVHDAFSTAIDQPGSITTFHTLTEDEQYLVRSYSRQIVAERSQEKIVPGRGTVIIWTNETGRQNHFLDATYLAFVAGHAIGVRVIVLEKMKSGAVRQASVSRSERRKFATPGGQGYLVTSRG